MSNSLETLNIRSVGSKPFLGWEGRLVRPAECMALKILRVYSDILPRGSWPRLRILGLGALTDNGQDVPVTQSSLDFRIFAINWIRDYRGAYHAGVIEVGHGNIGDAAMFSACLDIFEPM